MKKKEFETWLFNRSLQENTVSSRLANCRTVERYEGGLDEQFEEDGLAGLIGRLKYSKKDERQGHLARHKEVVVDNQKHRSDWIKALNDRNINATPYLWDRSACAFPGVRRYAGSLEIAIYRKHAPDSDTQLEKALKLDDNDYPKQVWSFVFRGAPFSKFGPDAYSLAHLADHKVHGNRYREDFDVLGTEHALHGLYTCPSNTVYIHGLSI